MKAKVCPKCNQEFPLTVKYFHKHKQSKDGFKCWCKKCNTLSACNWGKNNIEHKRLLNKTHEKEAALRLSNRYIKHQLWRATGIEYKEYPLEIIEIKKIQLKLHRECQQF